MEKQTAVQWLLSRIPDVDKVAIKGLSQIEREQALQMEREQIEKAWEGGTERNYDNFISGEDYYTQTFKP